jgi:heterodisulfide reductase subunit A
MGQIIVIGGGIAGLYAAKTLSPFHGVTLLEESDVLGGLGETLSCKAGADCSVCTACTIPELVEEVEKDANINVMTGTVVQGAEPTDDGRWHLTLEGSAAGEETANAVIIATGLAVSDGQELPEFGAGRLEGVMTALDLDRQLRTLSADEDAPSALPDDGGSIAFIQCAGSRDTGKLPYCSRVCCAYTARLALEMKERYPDASITVYYMDLQQNDAVALEQIDKAMAGPGIEYIRSRPASVQGIPGGGLEISYEDTLSGEITNRTFDRIVLSTGLVPSEGTARHSWMFGLAPNEYGFIDVEDAGPGSTAMPGVFAAGGAVGPVDMVEAGTSGIATAAAVLNDLPPEWDGRPPRVLLFGEEAAVRDADSIAQGWGVDITVLEGPPDERLHRLVGEPLDFHAQVDWGKETINADIVVVAAKAERASADIIPGAMSYSDAWSGIEVGGMKGRTVLLMGNDTEALRLAKAIMDTKRTADIEVLYRMMTVADGGMQELQLDLSSQGVRFHRYASGSIDSSPAMGGGYAIKFQDELSPELGEMTLNADNVVGPGGMASGEGSAWPIAKYAPDGVASTRRLNVIPIATPRRGVYSAVPPTQTEEARSLGGIAALTTAVSDYARGFPKEDQIALVDPELCAACLNCIRVCPHDAIVFDEEARSALVMERACQNCGECAATCPAKAITMVVPGEGGGVDE